MKQKHLPWLVLIVLLLIWFFRRERSKLTKSTTTTKPATTAPVTAPVGDSPKPQPDEATEVVPDCPDCGKKWVAEPVIPATPKVLAAQPIDVAQVMYGGNQLAAYIYSIFSDYYIIKFDPNGSETFKYFPATGVFEKII